MHRTSRWYPVDVLRCSISANITFISAPGTLNVTSALHALNASVSFWARADVNGFHPLSACHSQVKSDLLRLDSSPSLAELDAVLAALKCTNI